MRLLYCEKCHSVLTCQKPYPEKCPKCEETLTYFGREEASLSKATSFKEYDEKHAADPLKQLQGPPVSYQKQSIDLQILECLDSLKHVPENTVARFHLASLYVSKGSLESAISELENIVFLDPAHEEALNLLASIFSFKEHYSIAISYLEKIQETNLNYPYLDENIGVNYYYLKQYNPSLDSIKKAIEQETEEEELARLKAMMSLILSKLGKP
ncbi:MAG: hypothetical protein HRT90_08410 [Candidatus Margulisbacteria bacterium]|nr:hypothetical protein [Candidatus Margulisiibacteriota bacterium]